MTFTRELIAEIAKMGIKCSVIVPQSVSREIVHHYPVRPVHWVDHFDDVSCADIYQPRFVTTSSLKIRLFPDGSTRKAKKIFDRIKSDVDVLYGHFWRMGIRASKMESNLPVFVASGESEIVSRETEQEKERLQSKLAGVIYVSRDCFNESTEKGYQRNKPYIIEPNGFNPAVFFPRDKAACRKKLKWPSNVFVVSFLGSFSNRKGINRLSEALKIVNRKDSVYSCFIGTGSIEPDCPNILFKGATDHDKVAEYLCASDVFVLPTLHEGCSNAVVEALACGIPVISSNLPFNHELLDHTNAILIDPNSVDDIANAVTALYNNRELLALLSEGAVSKSQDLLINHRAERIVKFIRENL